MVKRHDLNKACNRLISRTILSAAALLPFNMQAQTLEECQQAAERHYPLIRQYALIEKTTALTVENIQKGWLPQITATAQATYQSDVTAWPSQMQTMMEQMGIELEGLKKDQYRVGLDISQTLFDGGAIACQKAIARRQSDIQTARTSVDIYQLRQRVNDMYFSMLFLEKQIELNQDLQELLSSNEEKLQSMYKNGTASESDYNAVKAERLGVVQQMTSLESQRQMLTTLLSAFCGIEVKNVVKPEPISTLAQNGKMRPELAALDAQLQLADAQEKALDAAIRPKLGVFAQGYYGYPGMNMFEDMMKHRWSLNGIIGARITWNIGALYTRKNDKAKIQLQRETVENQRDVFLFNNNLETMKETESINRYRRMMADDDEIISLRHSVRKAAESKLAHGIIDISALVREINAENNARLQQSIHEIEMLKGMYDLKFTENL